MSDTRTKSKAKVSKRKFIPVEESFAEWNTDPEFRKACDALEEEFSLVRAAVKARLRTGLTQAELAERMGAKQSLVARLENGGTLPSTRTLQRYAAATGSRLKITFEPVD